MPSKCNTLHLTKYCGIIDTYRILLHKTLKSCRSFVLFRALCQLTASQKCPCKQAFLLLVELTAMSICLMKFCNFIRRQAHKKEMEII